MEHSLCERVAANSLFRVNFCQERRKAEETERELSTLRTELLAYRETHWALEERARECEANALAADLLARNEKDALELKISKLTDKLNIVEERASENQVNAIAWMRRSQELEAALACRELTHPIIPTVESSSRICDESKGHEAEEEFAISSPWPDAPAPNSWPDAPAPVSPYQALIYSEGHAGSTWCPKQQGLADKIVELEEEVQQLEVKVQELEIVNQQLRRCLQVNQAL